jgi:hypothetical protein
MARFPVLLVLLRCLPIMKNARFSPQSAILTTWCWCRFEMQVDRTETDRKNWFLGFKRLPSSRILVLGVIAHD